MRYTVTWDAPALDDLANQWLNLSPKQRIHFSRCVDFIDRDLSQNAHDKGVPCDGLEPYRIATAPPAKGKLIVGVVFEVVPDDRRVTIHQVKTVQL